MIYLFCIIGLVVISTAWALGIDEMNEKYPNYKGDDFLNND